MLKPKLLFDENIGRIAAEELHRNGYDVKSVIDEMSGIDDAAVLVLAKKERRVLVTLDRDFGRLIFLQSHKHVGVIFLRLTQDSPQNIAAALLSLLGTYGSKLSKKFITISEGNIRIR